MQSVRTMILVAGVCLVSAAAAVPAAAQSSITCESSGNQFKECRIQTGGRVRLTQNISNTRCVYGRTWGFDWNAIWVDRGCRGRFMVNGSGSGWETGNFGQRVTCESQGGSYKICTVATNNHVRLVRQISQAACIPGRTWGYQANQIWVGNGCRAEFEVGRGSGGWQGDVRVVTCESQDGQYSRCFARTEGKVTIRRQISSSACVLNRSWGYDANGVWVNNGCRAEFAVGRGGSGSGWGQYPGTWPGPGNPGGGNGGNTEGRARASCITLATGRGYQRVSADNSSQRGSTVYVNLSAWRNSRAYDVSCQYSVPSGSARITSENQSGGANGGGNSNVEQRARSACTNRATSMGYQNVNVTSSRKSGSNVTVAMTARKNNRSWDLGCAYQQSNGTTTMTNQNMK